MRLQVSALCAGLLVGSWTGNAWAQASCGNPGPDVMVGELYNTSAYGSVGNIAAFSVGTYSCNVGNQQLKWEGSTNKHPVIGQNVFRLKDGRFEHIGQAWLKHGFTALQNEICTCDCTSSGTGSRLGVGCSDPYDAGLNGSQSGMGPKFEVNAHTGVFSYPYTDQGDTGNAIYKRIQIAIPDIDPAQNPGALYFVEGQYVAPDDSDAGNQNNNASYRRVTFSFSVGQNRWVMNLANSTQREQCGSRAWKDVDASVTEVDVQIEDEGLLICCAKVTDNGDGTWHYEYAVHNLNSDRSVGSVSVPAADSVAVTNIGFHDVPYHSGEPFDGTDWTGVRSTGAGAVTWETTPYNVNVNANAIRWGTLYNFRFDADQPPEDVTVTLGLFKPGTPDSVEVTLPGPSTPGIVGDLNGDCVVDLNDLSLLLVNFGWTGAGLPGDLDGDDDVDLSDLSTLLTNFGLTC